MPLDNDLVKKMSQLLEEGNTLLDEYCPKCGTPLFFIKSKKMRYCPKCNVYYVKENEAKERGIIKEMPHKEKSETPTKQEKEKMEFLESAYTLLSALIVMIYKALKMDKREDAEFYTKLLMMISWSVGRVRD